MNQEIRFCAAPDSTRLAYTKTGQGPPLVKAANWYSHLEDDWSSPLWQPWLEGWSRHHTLYRYDQRGCGLSDWNISDFSFDRLVGDLETVVDAAGLEKFDLLGLSQGSPVAIAYAARHPERVGRLIVYAAYVQGLLSANTTPEAMEAAEVGLRLLKLSWGTENPAYRQLYTKFLIRDGTPEQFAWLSNLELVSTSPENALALQRTFLHVDIRELAKTIQASTLVLHSKGDMIISFERGRQTAIHIPGARFVVLDGSNHILMATEPAAFQFWEEFYRFLGMDAEAHVPAKKVVASPGEKILLELSPTKREVLRLMAQGYNNMEIARKLTLSEKTVRNYISIIYAKLQINSRGEAIVIARQSGLVDDKFQ